MAQLSQDPVSHIHQLVARPRSRELIEESATKEQFGATRPRSIHEREASGCLSSQ